MSDLSAAMPEFFTVLDRKTIQKPLGKFKLSEATAVQTCMVALQCLTDNDFLNLCAFCLFVLTESLHTKTHR